MKTHSEIIRKLLREIPSHREFTEKQVMLAHAFLGVASEAGELADIGKKMIFFNEEPDRDHIIEELGDLESYMAEIRMFSGITQKEVFKASLEKIKKRYPEFKVTRKDCKNRADKKDP